MPADGPVRFAGYVNATLLGAKIDWDTPVELTVRVRRGLHPQDSARLDAGAGSGHFEVEAKGCQNRFGSCSILRGQLLELLHHEPTKCVGINRLRSLDPRPS